MQSCTGLLRNEKFRLKAEILISACLGILPNPQMIENFVFGGTLETLITAESNTKQPMCIFTIIMLIRC
jgi:hypothetical protein